ncbi:PLP-dependent aminotransferase family protein [Cupriavidus respiraculi]|uniref:MocR-like pyridoxine biosynthesis transcription factor PdxR n=1 Tax=Cupriavidus respiraculi TaxID=195930 RepID=UPI001C96ABBE|nr:PLP-dependent aminotransferase family protein [Cupriavidus respiraculi]MBY4947525.1 PLP-dependent aminotransferase family protein [Cupriavidus respiraculi]
MTANLLRLEPRAPTPLHEQVYRRFKALIGQGRLAPGQRVPSLRVLAGELGVARGTVEVGYDRLIGEGYLVARGPAGTFVADGVAGAGMRRAKAPAADALPAVAPALDSLGESDDGAIRPLQLGVPAVDVFPRKLWARLVARQARLPGSLAKPPSAGHAPLREALSAYLHRSRGIDAAPAQVFVVPGYTAALGLVADALLSPRDRAWVECPGYPPTTQVLSRLGHRVRPIPVDEEGIDVAWGRRRFAEARLAVVTPSHQSPTGVSLTLARRAALLDWAGERGAWVFEDDYDGEYRYRGHPLPALKSLDRLDRVIYGGTLSKVLYPGLRLSYVVVPQSQVSAFEAASRRALHGGCPELLQAVAAEFIEQGHFARHIKRMRALYAKRRALLAAAFAPYAPLGLTVQLREGGMHLLVALRDDMDDVALVRRAREAGFGLQALTDWRQGADGPRGLMVGFTNVATAGQAQDVVRRLMAALGLPATRSGRRGPAP